MAKDNMTEQEKSKKRKRQNEAQGGSSKKAATGAQLRYASVKVKHVTPEENALGPIVAATPGISAPEGITFTPWRRTVVSKSTEKKRRQILLQSSQHGRLDFIAQEEQSGGPQGNMRHYIGVFDPSAGEFTITECHKVTLRSTLRQTQEELDDAEHRERQTYASMRITLGQEFGTKKAKKVIADQTVNAIAQSRPGETAPPVDAAQLAMLDTLNVKTDGMMTAEEREVESNKAKPRPDPNMEATKPKDAYPVTSLVSEDDLSLVQVRDWQASAKEGKNMKLPMRYVARRLQKVASSKDTNNLKLLKYLNIMLVWFMALDSNRSGKRIPQREKLKEKVDAPGAILESLRKKFSDGREMTKWHVDKFILHTCAIALHIDNFELDTIDLQEDLRLNPSTMQQYFQELGCRVSAPTAAQRDMWKINSKEAAAHRVAKLRLPLEFPKPRTGRSGRGR
ncbi:uncharacterized protein PV09_00431 [Verruconis gallopava]|uniref:DNA-directed RNA polymerase I subunit RPA49 n=1 Tax=Verruconis gallopava TaxID=253628 RepID=A0A0D2AS94_9PEZI|nr:uncharacterized protein PV09_00431 [Verruconis gallopava]KIW09558.1 hypothetical protein PV09_00431 [Verruconis gallopava]